MKSERYMHCKYNIFILLNYDINTATKHYVYTSVQALNIQNSFLSFYNAFPVSLQIFREAMNIPRIA